MDMPSTSGLKRSAKTVNSSYSVSKKTCQSNAQSKEDEYILEEWLVEYFSDSLSDCDDPNFVILKSDHDSASEREGSEVEEKISEQQDNEASRSLRHFGENNFMWSKFPPHTGGVHTPRHNIVKSATSTSTVYEVEPKDCFHIWRKFFDDSIYKEILTWTNLKLREYKKPFKIITELHDIDEIELNAFLGILLYTAVFKSNHEDCDLLFSADGTGRDIFRCVFSKNRFLYILNCLCFDNPDTRSERKQEDKTAEISFLFNAFVNNCRKNFNMGKNATIHETLIGFRGRSNLIVCMPQKASKYGLKLQAIWDSDQFYFYDGYIYSGKGSDGEGLIEEERRLQVPTQCILRLIRDLHGSNRNIIANSRYGSVQCVEELKKRGLTFVGTLKKNKREIPPNIPSKKIRDVGSTLYGFTKDITLVSHVPKKNKAVLLLPSMHHNEENSKPEMTSYINSTKGKFDEIDKMCAMYSSSRRTQRWSMAIFFRMLDLSAINAGILYNLHSHKKIEDRSVFLKLLARSLVIPQLQRRYQNKRLPRELRLSISSVLGPDAPEHVEKDFKAEGKRTRKLCYLCPSKLGRKTFYRCNFCNKHVCLQCSKPVCKECR